MSQKQEVFPIVGIGASSGGLEAFRELLNALPDDTGMAYILVQHLDPTHASLLPDLLAQGTRMKVQEAHDGMSVEANQVYVITPNTDMTFSEGALQLLPRTETSGQHFSIDTFLRSLAQHQASRALAVILSGSATDGTRGLQAIKAEGGITFAQDPTTAQFAGMPQSAIAVGCVDFVGSPEAIAHELIRMSRHPSVLQPSVSEVMEGNPPLRQTLSQKREPEFQQIVSLLSKRTGTDFTAYKPSTLKRRIQRRMALVHIDRMSWYVLYLLEQPAEVEALYQDMLIGVTDFFRDAATFATLTEEVLPMLLAEKATHTPLRLWVPGCSTGQEVYSLVICLLEFFSAHALSTSLQLFGTDLNAQAIEYARAGRYPPAAVVGLTSTQRKHFFDEIDGTYQVHKNIRDLCVFAQHNVLKDPPFSRIDLLSCQNMLIYLGTGAQKKALESFHYALMPQGVLLLGPSETIGSTSSLFTLLGEHRRQWYRKQASGIYALTGVRTEHKNILSRRQEEKNVRTSDEREELFDLQRATDQLLAGFAPASVVINADMEILHFRGDTNLYLRPMPGRASLHLLKMARTGLDLELRASISKAKKSGQAVKREGIQFIDQGLLHEITIEVIPLQASAVERYFVILFRKVNTSPVSQPAVVPGSRAIKHKSDQKRIQQLEQELEATREEMRHVIAEAEAAHEELHSAHEESLSTNEELLSLNEELETSKEEMQASNEGLLVVNQELQQRNTDLHIARIYADAIVETIREPLLVLDAHLRVQRANRAFYQFFQVTPEQTENHFLFELEHGQWNIPALRTLLEQVLPARHALTDYTMESPFPRIGVKTLLLNAHRIEQESLILLAFEDITTLTQAVLEKQRLLVQREEFMAIASHELKTPVTSLKGYTQFLLRHVRITGDEQAIALLMKMDERIEKLVALINELLDVTTIEAGKLHWRADAFDLSTLIRACVEDISQTTQHQIHAEAMLPTQAFGNVEQTEQVLINFLSNAIKYSPQSGAVVVTLQTMQNMAVVGVHDFGIGIAPEQQAHLFERFFRVSDSEQTTVSGLGLGLYISAEIIKRQGGQIWVESQPGRGSTFFFTIPLAPETAPH